MTWGEIKVFSQRVALLVCGWLGMQLTWIACDWLGIRLDLAALGREQILVQKWLVLEEKILVGYEKTLATLQLKIKGLEMEKNRLGELMVKLLEQIKDLKHDRAEVVVFYERCSTFEEVAKLKEPFDLAKVLGYRSLSNNKYDQAGNEATSDPFDPIKVLLSKKHKSLQRTSPT
nr:hypothetical protein [Tanacetum cinerariifolium]